MLPKKGEPGRIQAYWNAYHCLNNVIVSDGKMYGKYVKTDSVPFVMPFAKPTQSIIIIRLFHNGNMFSL